MIPRDFITEWREKAPWVSDAQVEQDLVLSRCLVEIFSFGLLAERLAFRGGTALYKLFVPQPARYSEDLDLVQVTAEPIGDTINLIRSALDPWLGEPRRQFGEGRVTMVYRFNSEDQPPRPLRVKIEINSREHFSELGFTQVPYSVNSRWFQGEAEITTYLLAELLGTKLRALYQRRKGRDLFDLWHLLAETEVDPQQIVRCFRRYLGESGLTVSRAEFERNLAAKLEETAFGADMAPLLRPALEWEPRAAGRIILDRLISILPGLESKESS